MNEELKVIISAEIAEFTSATKDAVSALNNIQKELRQTNKEGEKTKKKAKSLGETFKKAFKEAKESAEENFSKIGKSIGNGLVKATKAIGNFAVDTAKAVATGATALSGAVLGVVKGTEEYRNGISKLTTAFETAGLSADTAKETYNDLYRVLGDSGQAVEASSHLAKLTTNEKELSKWTKICKGVYATFGDSLPIESLTEATNETVKTGEVTGALADALNWVSLGAEGWQTALGGNEKALQAFRAESHNGANNADAFSSALATCATEAERNALITSVMSVAYGEASDKFEENNAQILAQREAQLKLQETLARIGELLTPLITAFTVLGSEALAYIMPYIESFVNTYAPMIVPFIQSLAEKYLPILKEVLIQVADYAKQAISWVVDNWGIIAGIAGVITAIAVAIGLYNTVMAIKSAMDKAQVSTIWGLITAYVAQATAMLATIAPYVLIVGAIGALIAIIVLCVKHWDEIALSAERAWERIQQAFAVAGIWFGDVVESIKGAFSDIGEWFSDVFSKAWNGIKEAWNDVKEWFSNLWEDIKGVFSAVGNWFSELFTNAWNAIKEAWSDVSSWFSNLWEDIKGAFEDVINWFSQLFTDAWNGITQAWDSVVSWFSTLWEDIQGVFESLADWFSELFTDAWNGITEAWSEVESWFSELWEAIQGIWEVVEEWFSDTFSGAWDGIKEAWSSVESWFSDLWKAIQGIFEGVGDWFSEAFTDAYNYVEEAFSGITGFFSGIWEDIKGIFSDIGTAIGDGIKSAVSQAVNTVLSTAVKIINGFISAINFAIDVINAIPGVSISKIDKLSVPKMAQGGIVDSATLAVLGEQGKEAVVPLENNLEWLDKLAGMLNERMGGTGTIVLQVDGKTFADITCENINKLTRQRGSIPLIIA